MLHSVLRCVDAWFRVFMLEASRACMIARSQTTLWALDRPDSRVRACVDSVVTGCMNALIRVIMPVTKPERISPYTRNIITEMVDE